jgi:hypothetical protein
MSTSLDDEWIEYEVLGKTVRINKKALDAKVEAIRKEPGSLQDKIVKHFSDTGAVTAEPADPIESTDPASRERIVKEKP